MKIIGLTGKTGSGKSTVSEMLNAQGFGIVDGDVVARQVVEKGSSLLPVLAESFGSDILNPDGSLNRKKLSEKAFANEQATDKLNKLMHPVILKEIDRQVKNFFDSGVENVVVDAAALIECKYNEKCDLFVVVTAPYEVRLKRIMSRDNISEEAARLRMDAQKCDEFYFEKADIIINNFEPNLLENEIKKITESL